MLIPAMFESLTSKTVQANSKSSHTSNTSTDPLHSLCSSSGPRYGRYPVESQAAYTWRDLGKNSAGHFDLNSGRKWQEVPRRIVVVAKAKMENGCRSRRKGVSVVPKAGCFAVIRVQLITLTWLHSMTRRLHPSYRAILHTT